MSTPKYIQIDGIDNALASATENARERRDELVLHSASIRIVKTADDAQLAADALKDMKGFTRSIEDARTTVKAPVLKLTKDIDGLAKELTTAVTVETDRVSRLLGTYQQEQQRLLREQQEAAAREEQRIIEEANANAQKAIDSGRGVDGKLEKIEAQTFQKVAEVRAAVPTTAAISGLAGATDIIIEVTDLAALYAVRPELVKLELNLSLTKALIKANPKIALPGITHRQQAKVVVRG